MSLALSQQAALLPRPSAVTCGWALLAAHCKAEMAAMARNGREAAAAVDTSAELGAAVTKAGIAVIIKGVDRAGAGEAAVPDTLKAQESVQPAPFPEWPQLLLLAAIPIAGPLALEVQ